MQQILKGVVILSSPFKNCIWLLKAEVLDRIPAGTNGVTKIFEIFAKDESI